MHFVLSYQIINQQAGDSLKERVLSVISQYEYVVVFDHLILVSVEDKNDWDKIRTGITAIAKSVDGNLFFIMSPVISQGKYNGWLQSGSWERINKVSGYGEGE